MSSPPNDPIFTSSIRELKWILLIWLISFLWVVGYCGMFGYQSESAADQPIETVLGMPSWVFWGVMVPWVVMGLVSIWFAMTRIEDHDWGDEANVTDSETTDA